MIISNSTEGEIAVKDRIVLRKLVHPAPGGRTEFGLVLERKGSAYWLVKQTAFTAPDGKTECTELAFHMEKRFLFRANLETLSKKIFDLTGRLWHYADCPDKTALIDLLANNRREMTY